MSSSSSKKVSFNGPERLDYYSSKYDRENGITYHPDKSALRHFISPFRGKDQVVDLLAGFPVNKQERNQMCKPLNEMSILQWFKDNQPLKKYQKNPDFICNSRTLRSILSGDSNDRPNWEIIAVKFGDSILIKEVFTKQPKINFPDKTEHRLKTLVGSYADLKFIESSTYYQDGSKPVTGPNGYLDTFYTVNRSRIGDHTLLYSHPVHCIVDKDQYEKPLDEIKFAKLALRRNYFWNHPDRIHLWQCREVRWWSESVLSGVDTIYCGEKGRKNLLERVVGINAKSLPRNKSWTPDECFQRLDATLSFIKVTVTKELVPYKFEKNLNNSITVTELEDDVVQFIPRYFFKKSSSNKPKAKLDNRYSEQSSFEGPNRLGFFSCKYDHSIELFTYRADKSTLRYYKSPFDGNKVDLLDGLVKGEKWGRTPQSEVFILRWFVDNYNLAKEPSPSFICHSRILKSIMSDTLNETSKWEFIAIKVGESIIIDEVDTDQRKMELAQQKAKASANTFAGFKYIELSTRYQDDSKMTIGRGGYRDTFYTVNHSLIGDHTLLYSHGVDCISDKNEYEKSIEEMKFVKLATRSCFFRSKGQTHVWHRRAAQWWAESILSGVETIICGEKKRNNSLLQIINISAEKLAQNSSWTPNECFESLNSTLSLVKKIVIKELVPYKFKHNPDGEPVYTELDEPVENFIPDWFID